MSFNSRIKERREQLHLTRNELAEKIGVTQSAISNYENAISSPKVELLYKLFDALKCDAIHDIFVMLTHFFCYFYVSAFVCGIKSIW